MGTRSQNSKISKRVSLQFGKVVDIQNPDALATEHVPGLLVMGQLTGEARMLASTTDRPWTHTAGVWKQMTMSGSTRSCASESVPSLFLSGKCTTSSIEPKREWRTWLESESTGPRTPSWHFQNVAMARASTYLESV
jgi:hypothetical protein